MSFLKGLLKKKRSTPAVDISFIVIAYNMERAVKRTLYSLSSHYQTHLNQTPYEILLIDNGSDKPLPPAVYDSLTPEVKYTYVHEASASPAQAVNLAARQACGEYLCILIDGARMVTPGLVSRARAALSLGYTNPLVSVLGLHLGPGLQKVTTQQGYNEQVEDRLLAEIDWRNNGYRLFEIASLAGSCAYGWFGRMSESNCVFLRKDFFFELEGYDEKFTMPGGGLVNLDFYKRACEHESGTLIYLLGEGCFHQLHGGVTTGGSQRTYSFAELQKEYRALRGSDYRSPVKEPLLFGHLPSSALGIALQGNQFAAKQHDLIDVRQLAEDYYEAVS